MNTEINAPAFSTAGFHLLPDHGRAVFNFNCGWHFLKGDAEQGETVAFDDSAWQVVNLPHGLELLPEEASGAINYRGPAWYRKRFVLPAEARGRRIVLYFEAIMGKSKVWINGKQAAEHFGGYLPVIIDATDLLNQEGDNIIAVRADNSDDPLYPPGKPQEHLDFCYFGGIYRDCWLYTTDPVHITDANATDIVAGGGVFVYYPAVSEDKAQVGVRVHACNTGRTDASLTMRVTLSDAAGMLAATAENSLSLATGACEESAFLLMVNNPRLWSPNQPHLYTLDVALLNAAGAPVDGLRLRVGIRSLEFRGQDGFYLNGKPFEGKLLGTNRHQDFPHIGNALPNSGQWRDVQKLREAGVNIIRTAHYPPDPAFLDACDALGVFLINATPGWQHFDANPIFAARVYQDIRNMVRRDRNRACIIIWETVLNETNMPDDFARKLHAIPHEEYPYPGCFTAADSHMECCKYFDIIYSHPLSLATHGTQARTDSYGYKDETRSFFTREWGDNVDDWTSQNSPIRAARKWGEQPQLSQLLNFAKPPYPYSCMDALFGTPRQHTGGTLWCGFDHQRGYHPDPFYGGILDLYRQPKYAYYLFKSQIDPQVEPVLFVANDMNAFSGAEMVVLTNCDEVRLSVFGEEIGRKTPPPSNIPHPPIRFENAYSFLKQKELHHLNRFDESALVAEGFVGGKKMIEVVQRPALRKRSLALTADFAGRPLVADGSDIITIIATVVDEYGTVKHLAEDLIRFEVSGEGELLGDAVLGMNPRPARWGTAPALVRATTTPGKILIRATPLFQGTHSVAPAMLEIESIPAAQPLLYQELPDLGQDLSALPTAAPANETALRDEIARLKRELADMHIKEVGRQQEAFG